VRKPEVWQGRISSKETRAFEKGEKWGRCNSQDNEVNIKILNSWPLSPVDRNGGPVHCLPPPSLPPLLLLPLFPTLPPLEP
jgi:hypothetical protein